jgi:hypothetical protein
LSQPDSTYQNIELSGAADSELIVQLDPDTKVEGADTYWTGSIVWRYESDTWVNTTVRDGETIQDVYGYPRTIENAETGEKYEITETRVTLIEN